MIGKAISAFHYNFFHYPHTKKLIEAITKNDLPTFKKELKNSKDWDADGFPRSLLHEAIAQQKIEFVEALIENDVDVNEICEGMSALGRAIELKNIPIITLLLKKGANPHFGKSYGLPTLLPNSRATEKLIYDYRLNRNNPRKSNTLLPYLKEIEALLRQEKSLFERYQSQFQQASAIWETTLLPSMSSIDPPIITDSVEVPSIIIYSTSRYSPVEIADLLKTMPSESSEWKGLNQQLQRAQNESQEIEDIIKDYQTALTKKGLKAKIQLIHEYNPKVTNQLHAKFIYPNPQNLFQKEFQALEKTINRYPLPLLEALKNNDLSAACECVYQEWLTQIEPALHVACRTQALDIVELLLQGQTDVNQVFQGMTPLQIALASHNEQLAMMLVAQYGANPNEMIQDQSALHFAATQNWPQLTNALLKHGADTTLTCQNETPVDAAIRLRHKAVLQVYKNFEQSAPAHHLLSKHKTPNSSVFSWHTAAKLNDLEQMNALESLNIDCNAFDRQMGTPLHYAITCGQLEAVSRLLRNGADVSIKLNNRDIMEHACHLARLAPVNHLKIIEMLINENVHLHSSINRGALLNFCINHHLWDSVKRLIWQNASFDDKTTPPLLTAISYSPDYINMELVALLLSKGHFTQTSLWCMKHNVPTPLDEAIMSGNLSLLKLLFPYIRDLKEVTKRPPLHTAIRHGAPRNIIRFLIGQGCDSNEVYQDFTPLQLAIIHGNKDLAQDLAIRAEDLNHQDNDGNTALHLALEHHSKRHDLQKLIRNLIHYGANPYIYNQQGICAMDRIALNPDLQDLVTSHHDNAPRNALTLVLNNERMHSQLLHDENFGEAGLNWFHEQAQNKHNVQACLTWLITQYPELSQFVQEHLDCEYHQRLIDNQATLLAKFAELCPQTAALPCEESVQEVSTAALPCEESAQEEVNEGNESDPEILAEVYLTWMMANHSDIASFIHNLSEDYYHYLEIRYGELSQHMSTIDETRINGPEFILAPCNEMDLAWINEQFLHNVPAHACLTWLMANHETIANFVQQNHKDYADYLEQYYVETRSTLEAPPVEDTPANHYLALLERLEAHCHEGRALLAQIQMAGYPLTLAYQQYQQDLAPWSQAQPQQDTYMDIVKCER
ncbi:ankyrin repeat domain-containing protein [Candidatus Berkiella aquae]|uniref:Ankyrin repeat domain-containing protein n=1 Tax=Candidatus Berkiella aquae TaxID=295108 RepID=A0A0Q9YM89_9GAMM|nr:ankyrin repeat domain-containing protein [Candidatus Berkiella aquae]MCS5710092.1 ankyrin repeat domain-containing protein [Candidatus Berkiella aquae]